MNRHLFLSLALAALLLPLVGCVKNRPTLSQVPPPPDEVDPMASYQGGSTPTVVTREQDFNATPMIDYDPAPMPRDTSARPPQSAPEFDAENGPRVYVVRKNDNLWDIAVSQLGDGMRYLEIQKLNPNVNPEKLVVGSTLLLPSGKAPPRSATPAASGDRTTTTGADLPPLKDSGTSTPAPTTTDESLPPLKDDRGPRASEEPIGGGLDGLPPLPPVEPMEPIRMK